MASFTVEHKSSLSKEETFKKVKDYLQNAESLKKLDSKLEYSFDDGACTGQIKGSKFDCTLKVDGSSPSTVSITVSLSFLLGAFKGKIQETLQSKIEQVLG